MTSRASVGPDTRAPSVRCSGPAGRPSGAAPPAPIAPLLQRPVSRVAADSIHGKSCEHHAGPGATPRRLGPGRDAPTGVIPGRARPPGPITRHTLVSAGLRSRLRRAHPVARPRMPSPIANLRLRLSPASSISSRATSPIGIARRICSRATSPIASVPDCVPDWKRGAGGKEKPGTARAAPGCRTGFRLATGTRYAPARSIRLETSGWMLMLWKRFAMYALSKWSA